MYKQTSIIIIILLIGNLALAQTVMTKTPVDSIYFAGYKAVYYKLAFPGVKNDYQWIVENCDSLILSSEKSPLGVKIYNFCENATGPRITCNFQDIDNDGRGEIIFEILGEDKNSGEEFQFFAPDLINTVGPVFDGREKGYGK
jgi:hypothetical protein